MGCSKARLAANRANALRSTGPRTDGGKARSRANSVRHGMTGAGVVLPDEASTEAVAARASGLRRAFATETLARRLAVLSDRLDRLDRRDRADTSGRVRRAGVEAAEQRQAGVDALVERLAIEPDVCVRRLRMTPEGCDRLIELWEGLGSELARGRDWSGAHVGLARALAGRQEGARSGDRVDVLADIARGGERYLPADDSRDDPEYRARVAEGARLALADLVAGQIDGVEARRAELPAVAAEIERAEEADLALFDESRRGELFRRYEQTTERHLFRALVELERLDDPTPMPSLPETPETPMGSFGEIADPAEAEAELEVGAIFEAEGVPISPPVRPEPPSPGERESADRATPANGRGPDRAAGPSPRGEASPSPFRGSSPPVRTPGGGSKPGQPGLDPLVGPGWGEGPKLRPARPRSRRPRLPGSA